MVSSESNRRQAVLESALETFSRLGYRKTSMEDVAHAAHISRPGLYFLFESKPALFRLAITHALNRDLRLITEKMDASELPLTTRLVDAFDRWEGSYVGPLASEVIGVVDTDRSLLGSMLVNFPLMFEKIITQVICESFPTDGRHRARTLISASIGIKHQVVSREDYLGRLTVAVKLLCGR